jgi:signal transduction histidine kinase
VGKVWQEKRSLIIEDYQTWPQRLPQTSRAVRAVIACPLYSEKTVNGVIALIHSRPHRNFRLEHIEVLERFAALSSLTLDNAYLYAELQKGKTRIQAILNAIPDIVLHLNREGQYLDIPTGDNSDLVRPVADLIGQSIRDVLPIRSQEDILKTLQAALDTDTTRVMEYSLEFPEGLRQFEGRFVKSGEDDVLVFIRNITDRKQSQSRQLALNLERERVKMLEDFISDASHDLKTPISNLRSRLYLMRKSQDDANRERQLTVMEAEVLRLERLIEDLLTMAQLDRNAHFNFEPVHLNHLVYDVFKTTLTLAQQKGLSLTYEPADLRPIWGEPLEVHRVIMNLVSNAVNYTPQGSVTIRTREENNGALLEVSDTGIGIAPEDQPRIFERFYRADKARSTDKGGTGLGLAIVKKVVDLHQGQVRVISNVGVGTRFEVWLPYANFTQTASASKG